MTAHRTELFTVPWMLVNVPTRAGLLAEVRDRLSRGSGFSIATLNLDHAVKLQHSEGFRQAYAAQTHITADGRPIVWLSRLARRPVDLITGSDLVDPLVALCAEQGAPIAILGSTQTILDNAAARLQDRHPGLEVVARLSPPMGFDPEGPDARAFVATLADCGARVCLLALGAPKQEAFAALASRSLPDMGFVSIGAGLDFVAGAQRRAPRLVQRLALEWLWRLLASPRRLAWRYAQCVMLLPVLARRALSMRFSGQIGKAG